jgi:hypothetical protein
MSSRPDLESPPRGERRDRIAAIRSAAFGALVAGGVCLYFGFAWSADAPASATPEETQVWYMVDHVFQWWLRVLGIGFLAAAGLSGIGHRLGALLSAAAEAAFAVLMLGMIVNGYLESRAMGGFDATLIIFAVLLVVSVSACRHSWSVFAASSPGSAEREPAK